MILAQSRTVTVERITRPDGVEVVRKTYSFPTAKDRRRSALRGTWIGRNKAHREFANLQFLRRADVPAVEPLCWTAERNQLGFVQQCTLETRAYDATDLAKRMQKAGGDPSRIPAPEVWQQIGASVWKMHEAGFWHRGLSPRNLLLDDIDTDPADVSLHWLDPAKSLTWRPGALSITRKALDLLRFWTPLQPHLPEQHQQAFARGYGNAESLALPELWDTIPNWKRASTRRELQREEARMELAPVPQQGHNPEQP
ncbi:MAG: lipopolysaccharide kinase InaA family protein [Planctomycetota bacterium]